MPITVTWDDGDGLPTSFIVPDDVYASIDSFRTTDTAHQVFDPGQGAVVPRYATVKDLIVGVFVQSIILPALAQFPTADIQAAQAGLASAALALQAAQAAAIPGFVAETRGQPVATPPIR